MDHPFGGVEPSERALEGPDTEKDSVQRSSDNDDEELEDTHPEFWSVVRNFI